MNEYRSAHCRHEQSCVYSHLVRYIKLFCQAYGFRVAIGTIIFLVRIRRQSLSSLLGLLFSRDYFKFSFFISIQTLLLKSSLCVLRRVTSTDSGWNYHVAGFLSGYFSIRFCDVSKRRLYTYLLLSRALNALYLQAHQKLSIQKHSANYEYCLLFMVALSLSSYAIFNEIDLMHITLQNNCAKMVPDNKQNWKLIVSTNQMKGLIFKQMGIEKLK